MNMEIGGTESIGKLYRLIINAGARKLSVSEVMNEFGGALIHPAGMQGRKL